MADIKTRDAVKGTIKTLDFPCCLVFISEFAAVWGVSVLAEAAEVAETAGRLAAKATAKATAEATKATVKATIAAVRAIIAGTKALISALIAGGWIAVVGCRLCGFHAFFRRLDRAFGCGLDGFFRISDGCLYRPLSLLSGLYQRLCRGKFPHGICRRQGFPCFGAYQGRGHPPV